MFLDTTGNARAAPRDARRVAARLRRAGCHHGSDSRANRTRYEAGEGTAYELCATFELATTEARAPPRAAVLPARGGPPLLPASGRGGPQPMMSELVRGESGGR